MSQLTNEPMNHPKCLLAHWSIGSLAHQVAGAQGFEPRSTDPKSGVLPLHHAPTAKPILAQDFRTRKYLPCVIGYDLFLVAKYNPIRNAINPAAVPALAARKGVREP